MRSLLVCLMWLWVLGQTAGADQAGAGYDWEVARLLEQQSGVLARAGGVVETWVRGRSSSSAALDELHDLKSQLAGQNKALQQLKAPAGAAGLQAAAKALSRDRAEWLNQAEGFIAGGDPSKQTLQAYLAASLKGTATAQSRWLQARMSELKRLRSGRLPASCQAFYTWQEAVMRINLKQIGLSQELQAVMAGDCPAGQGPQRAADITRKSLQLRAEAEAIGAPKALLAAQSANLAEQTAMARLAEAVQLFLEDPSPEASSRLRRASLAVQQAAQKTEAASLAALKQALSGKP